MIFLRVNFPNNINHFKSNKERKKKLKFHKINKVKIGILRNTSRNSNSRKMMSLVDYFLTLDKKLEIYKATIITLI